MLDYKTGDIKRMKKNKNKKPVLIAISGIKNSGKTTLIEKLIPNLTEEGFKTAVIKHDGHSFTPDVFGKDTYRFFAAGACATAIYDNEKQMIVRRNPLEDSQFENLFPDSDIIFLEGFKYSDYPKLEVVRCAVSDKTVCNPETCIAYVSNVDLITDKPVFGLDDINDIKNYLIQYLENSENNKSDLSSEE